ncbi:MAG: right-handed parallel beta-helix repeat-containing protein [Acidobacteria bacterium]|nr:MAG: right-handed parallel beta-helix repeat-containing protein [Acidobacteriota bacterium]
MPQRDITPHPYRFARPAVVALAALLALPAALASGGRIPIHSVPLTITEPGSYYLSRDVVHSGGGEAITIAASHVTIDFAGHTLTKQNAGNYTVALDGDYTDITIRNGRIEGGNIGIRLRNTLGADFAVLVEDMEISGALNEGIYVQGHSLVGSSQAVIRDNLIHDTGNDGISLRFMWGGRVEGNVVQDPGQDAGDHGIYLHSCRGVTVTRNTVAYAGGDGIRVWYSWYVAVDWNHVTYNSGWGVNLFDGDRIVFSNNRAYGNGSGGFTIPVGEGHVNAGGNYPPPV